MAVASFPISAMVHFYPWVDDVVIVCIAGKDVKHQTIKISTRESEQFAEKLLASGFECHHSQEPLNLGGRAFVKRSYGST